MALVDKLSPARFPGMSPKMGAIVGYVLDESFTDPSFDDMCITSDGFVLGQLAGDVGMNEFVGNVSDLERNWTNLLDVAGLDESERTEAEAKYRSRITDWRNVEVS